MMTPLSNYQDSVLQAVMTLPVIDQLLLDQPRPLQILPQKLGLQQVTVWYMTNATAHCQQLYLAAYCSAVADSS